MANSLYNKARQAFMSGGIDLTANDIKAVLVDADYVFDAAHEFLTSVSADAVATSANLTNKSVTNGVFDADDLIFAGLTGSPATSLVLYQDTGTPSTSRLILYIDEGTFPITPNGGDQTIVWSDGANKIFRL
jgi:hypothetical protein